MLANCKINYLLYYQ